MMQQTTRPQNLLRPGQLRLGLLAVLIAAFAGNVYDLVPVDGRFEFEDDELVASLSCLAMVVIGAFTWLGFRAMRATERHSLDLRNSLDAKEREYEEIVASISDYAIFALDTEGHVTTWNAGAERIFGYHPDEIIGEYISVFYPEHERQSAPQLRLRQATTSGRHEAESWRVRADGSLFWANVITTARKADGLVRGFSTIVRDLTERRKLEEQLTQAQKMEAVGQLAGGIAHDFNNLLAVILNYAEFMEDEVPEAALADLGEIRDAARRGSILVRQLLTFARKQTVNPEPLDVNAVIQKATALLERAVGAAVELSISLEPDLPAILADEGEIEQILMNLVVNARDAMANGGVVTLTTRSSSGDIGHALPGRHVILSVGDTGSGMDAATSSRIFEPFFSTKGNEGTGLGLATVYGIVDRGGGVIDVYSEPSHGTVFNIRLPAIDGVATHPPGRSDDEEAPSGDGERILVVEDDAALRNAIVRVLQGAGYVVTSAPDPGQAEKVLAAQRVNLILTDIVMPVASGKTLAEVARTIQPDVRVLFMSGYAEELVRHHGLHSVGSDFIQKPFTRTALLNKVAEQLHASA